MPLLETAKSEESRRIFVVVMVRKMDCFGASRLAVTDKDFARSNDEFEILRVAITSENFAVCDEVSGFRDFCWWDRESMLS
jgi:hypothetical protein